MVPHAGEFYLALSSIAPIFFAREQECITARGGSKLDLYLLALGTRVEATPVVKRSEVVLEAAFCRYEPLEKETM